MSFLSHISRLRLLYFFLPQVFSCTAFVHDHSSSFSKLVPLTLISIFVDYLCTQKGYCVYFVDTRCYVTLVYVTFHEDSFYFFPSPSSSHPSTSPPLGFLSLVIFVDPHFIFSLSLPSSLTPLVSTSSINVSIVHVFY